MALWYELNGLFPLRPAHATTTTSKDHVMMDRWRHLHHSDVLAMVFVLLFLVGSYVVCCCCQAQRRRRFQQRQQQWGSTTTTQTFKRNHGVNHMATAPQAALLVSEMEEPLLGPPDYQQPPAFEISPPAYEHLPSAPPISPDHFNA